MSEVRQLDQQTGSEVKTNKRRTDTTDRNLTRPMRLVVYPTLQTMSANSGFARDRSILQQRRTADGTVQRVISIRQGSPPTSLSSAVRLLIYYIRLPVSVAREM